MKIQDLLNQSKPCWKYAAMDEDGTWYIYTEEPYLSNCGTWTNELDTDDISHYAKAVGHLFDIEPFEGDWKDSLIEREGF